MTSQWVAKRKLIYGSITLVLFLAAIGIPSYVFFHKVPSCFDGRKNQNEKGIDCGGVCTLLCSSDIVNPIVLWQRAFMVTPGVYNVAAYVQNPNVLSRIDNIAYDFKLYDSKNVIIGERKGVTFIPANQTFAVFEAGIRTGGRVPARTSFTFTDPLTWSQNPSDYKSPSLFVENVVLSGDINPRIDAVIRNQSLQTIPNLEVVAIIYDESDNAMAASRTIVQGLNSGSTAPVVFTWPSNFPGNAVRKEILLRTYPVGVTF